MNILQNRTLLTKLTLLNFIIIISLVAAITFSGMHITSNEMRNQAQQRQETALKVAKEVLTKYGSQFRIDGDTMYIDDYKLNDDTKIVDRVKELVGGTATIFMNDKRVTTNVQKSDGTRAVGTFLAKGVVYDTVLKTGKTYFGEADILGNMFFTAYDPIFDKQGNVIGILYVGLKQSELMTIVSHFMYISLAVALGIGIIALCASFVVLRKISAPIISVEQNVENVSKDLLASVQRTKDVIAHITSLSSETQRLTTDVSTAKDTVHDYVQNVAGATQELSSSVDEIMQHMHHMTSTTVASAVEQVEKASDQTGQLKIASQKIGDVVTLINDIAEQTNLLALNASIEAARAGEAGRGFAVVADEVKKLAVQTAKATGSITEEITSMQDITESSVKSINDINEKMEEVRNAAQAVSASVAEQGSATQEIAENLQSVTNTVDNMSATLNNVVSSIQQSDDATQQIDQASGELVAESEKLDIQVENLHLVLHGKK